MYTNDNRTSQNSKAKAANLRVVTFKMRFIQVFGHRFRPWFLWSSNQKAQVEVEEVKGCLNNFKTSKYFDFRSSTWISRFSIRVAFVSITLFGWSWQWSSMTPLLLPSSVSVVHLSYPVVTVDCHICSIFLILLSPSILIHSMFVVLSVIPWLVRGLFVREPVLHVVLVLFLLRFRGLIGLRKRSLSREVVVSRLDGWMVIVVFVLLMSAVYSDKMSFELPFICVTAIL